LDDDLSLDWDNAEELESRKGREQEAKREEEESSKEAKERENDGKGKEEEGEEEESDEDDEEVESGEWKDVEDEDVLEGVPSDEEDEEEEKEVEDSEEEQEEVEEGEENEGVGSAEETKDGNQGERKMEEQSENSSAYVLTHQRHALSLIVLILNHSNAPSLSPAPSLADSVSGLSTATSGSQRRLRLDAIRVRLSCPSMFACTVPLHVSCACLYSVALLESLTRFRFCRTRTLRNYVS
jgi:hypothetical protein